MTGFNKLVLIDCWNEFSAVSPSLTKRLRRLARNVLFYRTIEQDPQKVIRHLQGADAVFLGWTSLTREILMASSSLRYVGVVATGFNMVDIRAAKEEGITVTNVPSYSTNTVAEFLFGQLITFLRRSIAAEKSLRPSEHSLPGRFWEKMMFMGSELEGRTLGIIGLGQIGQRVAEIAKVFKMKIVYWNRHRKKNWEKKGVRYLPFKKLLKEGDVISLHVALNDETRGLIGAKEFSLMKKNAILINFARGAIVEKKALLSVLQRRRIAGAIIDVYEKEPPDPKDPLLKAPNSFLSPHIAWLTWESNERMFTIAVENAEAFLRGRPKNVVS
ncbi:MAG: D-2-hydroxyacid dehydrogenase [Deltaproteobacteria bacterium]|nr:D-2-hydroxyacid dehydrogenase [Deltaproteobacteria bacterium]